MPLKWNDSIFKVQVTSDKGDVVGSVMGTVQAHSNPIVGVG